MDVKKQLLKPVEKIPFRFMSDAELVEFSNVFTGHVQAIMTAVMDEVDKRGLDLSKSAKVDKGVMK